MIDLRPAMKPKSDQLNADDLITGPITIRIREIKDTEKSEQRFWFYYEGDDGNPWKPCKGMLRIMSEFWGFDGSVYMGRSITLYRDPKTKWAGSEVGGIRISHMSDLSKEEVRTVITISQNRREEYRVRRLALNQEPTPAKEPAVDLPEVAGRILNITAETIDKEASAIKKLVAKWPREEKMKVSDLIRSRRELLGSE